MKGLEKFLFYVSFFACVKGDFAHVFKTRAAHSGAGYPARRQGGEQNGEAERETQMNAVLFMNGNEYKEIDSQTFLFENNEYEYIFCKHTKAAKFYVIICGVGLFGCDTCYSFSSEEAAKSFILFIISELRQEHLDELNEIAKIFELRVKYKMQLFFASLLEMSEADAFKP